MPTMKTCIVLLRGINVGGNAVLSMKTLCRLLEDLGAQAVRTYIQSGNAVLQIANDAHLAPRLTEVIQRQCGFAPAVWVMPVQALALAMANNPFPHAVAEPSSLHLGFMADTPKAPDMQKLQSLQAASEQFRLIGPVFYLHAPDGIGRSKLAAGTEKCIGLPMTLRNWRTVSALAEMAQASSAAAP